MDSVKELLFILWRTPELKALIYAMTAGGLGFLISLTYQRTGKVSKNMAGALIVLPMLICILMIMVNGNLGASIAVVGTVGLVRFRSLQGDARELTYIFFAATIGASCSMGFLLIAVGITILCCILLLIFYNFHFAAANNYEKHLSIMLPAYMDYQTVFKELMAAYTKTCRVVRISKLEPGNVYEIEYMVTLKNIELESEFLHKISEKNSNLSIVCEILDYNDKEL